MLRRTMAGAFGAALVFATALGGCHGVLHDLADDVDGGADAAAGLDAAGGPVTFIQIQRDLDALGCSATGPCHGGGAPMTVHAGARDEASLLANYTQVRTRAASDAASLLVTKPLQTSGISHAGGQPFASPEDATYQRWLGWIRAGTPYAPDGGAP